MPLLTGSAVALLYADGYPSAEELTAADSLIQTELASESTAEPHPSIPALRETRFSELVRAEHERLSSGKAKQGGVDMSRYEALDAPEAGQIDQWRTALQRAYVSAEYMRSREVNLSLLETYGKNAWLIGNSQLEDALRELEKDLQDAKAELENLEETRRGTQGDAAGEMHGLDESWRKGVGRMIETQAAAERLKQEILQRRRAGAG